MKITVFLLLLFASCKVKPVLQKEELLIVYYNPIDASFKNGLADAIAKQYNVNIIETIMFRLPDSAYYKPRNRYRAEVLLSDMVDYYDDFQHILGVTTQDISTTKNDVYDWGVVGLANLNGVAGVISTFRIKSENKQLFKDRFIKAGLHEFGHTKGLPHCPNASCFMHDANGLVSSIDNEKAELCNRCASKIIF